MHTNKEIQQQKYDYSKTQSQSKKQTTAKPVQNKKNQSELKYKVLNDGTVAASDTIDGKLFHNTAPR